MKANFFPLYYRYIIEGSQNFLCITKMKTYFLKMHFLGRWYLRVIKDEENFATCSNSSDSRRNLDTRRLQLEQVIWFRLLVHPPMYLFVCLFGFQENRDSNSCVKVVNNFTIFNILRLLIEESLCIDWLNENYTNARVPWNILVSKVIFQLCGYISILISLKYVRKGEVTW